MVKIMSGWTSKGGSTIAFINLTNKLNSAGYETKFYGPHPWHLDKCNAGILTPLFKINENDIVITHFIQLPERPLCKKVILSCHEKNLFRVGKIKQYWDIVVFINDKHREYHNDYNNKYTIIPNLKENLNLSDKTGLDKIAGIIGSFDDNKQTHISIQRAIDFGCEKIFLFGDPNTQYFYDYVKPLLSDKVILKGFMDDKQKIYDMIGCVFHSSKSEADCLVKHECETTGTIFYGNGVTDNPIVSLTNDEIIEKWVNLLNA